MRLPAIIFSRGLPQIPHCRFCCKADTQFIRYEKSQRTPNLTVARDRMTYPIRSVEIQTLCTILRILLFSRFQAITAQFADEFGSSCRQCAYPGGDFELIGTPIGCEPEFGSARRSNDGRMSAPGISANPLCAFATPLRLHRTANT